MKGYSRIHGIAHCSECDWQEEDYRTVLKNSKKHHKETGHEINIELGYWRKIEAKKIK
jgi:hypothetical protein